MDLGKHKDTQYLRICLKTFVRILIMAFRKVIFFMLLYQMTLKVHLTMLIVTTYKICLRMYIISGTKFQKHFGDPEKHTLTGSKQKPKKGKRMLQQTFDLTGQSATGLGLARSNGPSTQHAAAQAISSTLPKSRMRVLKFLVGREEHGATDEEIELGLHMKGNGVRPRRNELMKNCEPPLVKFAGRTRKGVSGMSMRVYKATLAGIRVVRDA